MPGFNRGKRRNVVTYVEANPVILYGFKTKDLTDLAGVTQADLTAIGHLTPTEAAALAGRIPVIGADAPRPPRVVKRLDDGVTVTVASQGSVSTFAGYNNVGGSAQAAGWQLSKPGLKICNLKKASPRRRNHSVVAKLSNGALYVYSLNAADFVTFGTNFGLQAPESITTEAEKHKLVSGCRLPRPGKARVELENSFFETFYSHNATLAGADTLSSEALLSLAVAP